ncbi:nuclear transport factor 2 family protein [Microbacterium sp. HD4P20]|uniref:nuclear transport factor 2 family protein n=1 Tax=Microbacterium sp. HD4P20 TaxID=2864874 RepID=UPI001C6413E5|nr:nuclear transport factor 2 family protein [Microbacterium sp. HD4P20]MCP2635259.1 nuclear transport factor 2 family protein [Microbacterium sp. HD4P20]
MTSALDIVQSYHASWTSGDVDHALTHLSDDVRCFAPDPEVRTKEEWRKYLNAFVPMLTAAPELTRMTDSDRVALWYYPQTETSKTVLASELFVVEDGAIVEIRLAFDRLGYAPVADAP